MALTQDEVKIRLGIDSRAIAGGLTGVSGQIGKFVEDTRKKFMSLARANIYLAAADVMRQIIPTAKEFWDKMYGTDDQSNQRIQAFQENMRNLRKGVQDAQSALAKHVEDFYFKKASPLDQVNLLDEQLKEARQKADRAKDQIPRLQAGMAGARANNDMGTLKLLTEKVAAAQKAYNEQLLRTYQIQDQINEIQKKIRDGAKPGQTVGIGQGQAFTGAMPPQLVPYASDPRNESMAQYYDKFSGMPGASGAEFKRRAAALRDTGAIIGPGSIKVLTPDEFKTILEASKQTPQRVSIASVEGDT